MASTAATPYGLKPVRLASGAPFNSEIGEYRIASGYGTALFTGMPVRMVGGYIQACSAANLGTSASPDKYIGVFMGCSYTDPNTLQKVWKNQWPTGTVAADAVAFVADQVGLVCQVQVSTTAYDVLSNFGNSCALSAATGGSTTTGNSNLSLVAGTQNANLPFKIVGISRDPTNINAGTGLYLDALVVINWGFHALGGNTTVG